ncbi:MAG: prephenate dehydrogenase [Acidaminococcaceae bacterium]
MKQQVQAGEQAKKVDQEVCQGLVFGIVGLGLMGGSYAKALRRLGARKIIGLDRDKAICRAAQQEGLVDFTCDEQNEALREVNVLICAVYPSSLLGFVQRNVSYLHPQVLLTDVLGIKGDLPAKIAGLLGPQMAFVAGHPLAGKEGQGLAQADADIFVGANYLVMTGAHNRATKVEWLKNFALALGCKQVVEMTPAEHDALIAYTSNLPHVLALALLNSTSFGEQTKDLVGGSFRDATRVATINAELWSELLLANRRNVQKEISNLQAELAKWSEALRRQDQGQVEAMMKTAAARRRDLTDGNNNC